MRILYLTHDLNDATTLKRVRMLLAGGAQVTVAGFSRGAAPATLADCSVICFGQTHNGRFAQRGIAVLRSLTSLRRHHALFAGADLILARNLEMLAIAVRGRSQCASKPTLVYEVLDIHRLLLREDAIGTALRGLEGWLSRRASAVITSSPAFISEYFAARSRVKLPMHLLENKVFPAPASTPLPARAEGKPWRIGWFGAIRCRKSLDILCAIARENPGLLEVVIRGRPSYDQFENFDAQVNATPGISFLGPYRNPDDLAAIYGDVHFSWAIDFFEEGQNSRWLLPNRLYEGGRYHTVPLAVEGVETAKFLEQHNIGQVVQHPLQASLTQFLKTLTPEHYSELQAASATISESRWVCDDEACRALVQYFQTLIPVPPQPRAINASAPLLVVVPCLNERAHIGGLIDYLVGESQRCPMRIVIADGGSSDGTIAIIQEKAALHTNVIYLPNPKRIQSAAVNLAVAQFGNDSEYLLRIDAHGGYPAEFAATLLAEAARTGADSVVVSMETLGKSGFQEAVAAAQNSKLGNGGSAHRSALGDGKWVEHGHHALMRIEAYRAVGGYDESFTHNEDAELDVRLRRAGYRIWLTGATQTRYFPRATPLALYRQYRNYGRGRVRTLLKHHEIPKLRQMLPVAVLPAAALLLAAPLFSIAALPFIAWASICLAYGGLIAWKRHTPNLALSGPAAMLMHGGWSVGFWQGLVQHFSGKRA